MYGSGFLKNTNTGKLVRFKAIDPTLFNINFASADNSLILSIIDIESDDYSKDKVYKDVYFNDNGKAMFIYDKGLDVGVSLGNLLPYEGELETEEGSLEVEGELIIVSFGDATKPSGESLYEIIKNLAVGGYQEGTGVVYMRHTLEDQELMAKEMAEAQVFFTSIGEEPQYVTFINADGEPDSSLVDNLYRYKLMSENESGSKINDYINLNFKVKAISTSSVCNVENMFI